MAKSLCKGKRVKPNKCKKLRGCKVASGKTNSREKDERGDGSHNFWHH